MDLTSKSRIIELNNLIPGRLHGVDDQNNCREIEAIQV